MFEKNNDYQMKKSYNADTLVVANLQRLLMDKETFESKSEITEQKYLFELINDNGKSRYREIFTGFIIDTIDINSQDEMKFINYPYIYEPQKFTDFFPNTKNKELSKIDLIWIQNDINILKNGKDMK